MAVKTIINRTPSVALIVGISLAAWVTIFHIDWVIAGTPHSIQIAPSVQLSKK